MIVCFAIMHLPLGSTNSVSSPPPLDPPMSCTLPQVHPRELPRAKHTLPRAPGTLPHGSQGRLGTSEMNKVDHQKPAKYKDVASRENEKLTFCIVFKAHAPFRSPPLFAQTPPKALKCHPRRPPRSSWSSPRCPSDLAKHPRNEFATFTKRRSPPDRPQGPSQGPMRPPKYRKLFVHRWKRDMFV